MSNVCDKKFLTDIIKDLEYPIAKWACKSMFWLVATGFTIVKLVNSCGQYGVFIGRQEGAQYILQDMSENKREDN